MFNRIIEEIDSFFARDPAAHSRWEVVLCYPGFHAVILYRAAHWLWEGKMKLLARMLSQFTRWITGIEIHPGATIGKNFFIDHGMGVVIGETATIGDNVTLYHDVTLGGVSVENMEKGTIRHPQIGNNVIIGSGAQLLGPITVGDDARIGSNAVVVKDVPEKATMVGIPARNVRRRSTEEITEQQTFEAYGVLHGDVPDPVLQPMEKMVKEITTLQKRIEELEAQQQDVDQTAKKWESANNDA